MDVPLNLWIGIVILATASVASAEFTIAKFFSSHMVLQELPSSANIFGNYDEGPVLLSIDCDSGLSYQYEAELEHETKQWMVEIDPISSGESCQIEIVNVLNVIVLEDVLFGDVWFCSGQSNMGWAMLGIENRTEEIAASQNYTNIRFFRVATMTSDKEEHDLLDMRDGWTEWANPRTDSGNMLLDFSAIPFLFARGISEPLGNKPIGLISSAYAGTHIEAWSPPETLANCDIEDYVDEKHDQNSNSHLFNAMISPFLKMRIKGALWYQGESNSFWNTEKYKCVLQNMFRHWRLRWDQASNSQFPFGVVTLGPFANPPIERTRKDVGDYFPLIRWHQTFDYGYLPNEENPNTFMALVIDTYYNGTEHPRNKQLTANRLAIAGLSIAYQKSEYPSAGPFPINIEFAKNNDKISVEVNYDEEVISYMPQENSGFFFCCGENNSSTCRGDQFVKASDWKLLHRSEVSQTKPNQITILVPTCNGPSSLGYLWAESPVTKIRGLPIYSTNGFDLPAAPWWKNIYV